MFVADSEARSQLVDQALKLITDPASLKAMETEIARMGIPDSASRIADEVCRELKIPEEAWKK